MRSLCLVAVALSWSCVARAAEPAAPAKELSAAEIVQKSEQAYEALDSYIGTTTVTSVTEYNNKRTEQHQTDARIQFLKPNKIRIDGHDNANRAFVMISDGSKTWMSWKLIKDGAFEEMPDATLAIASITGVSLGAARDIPSILLKLNWGQTRGMKDGKLLGREKVSGADCYKLRSDAVTATAIRTYWVDAQTFLLRQYASEMDELRLARMERLLPQKVYEEMQKNNQQIKSILTTHTFAVENTTVPPDESLFANPLATAAKTDHVENQAN